MARARKKDPALRYALFLFLGVWTSLVGHAWGLVTFTESEYRFSVTENSAAGTTVGRVYLVDDAGSEVVVESVLYTLTPSTGLAKSLDLFAVDNVSGLMTNIGQLDREQVAVHRYQLRARFRLPGQTGVSTRICRVTVTILDVNDNAPRFDTNSSYASIPEGYADGSILTQVLALDPDEGSNSVVSYSFLQSGVPFTISQDGSVFVAGNIDREVQDHFDIIVRASDNGHPQLYSQHRLFINVLDLNDNAPKFTFKNYIGEIDEGLPRLTRVIQVRAIDLDGPVFGQVTYAITSGNSQGLFYIDMHSGWVSTLQSLDADVEGGSSYTLRVRAEDIGGLFDSAVVTITVNNLNDHAPQFLPDTKTSIRLLESVEVGTDIMTVSARDEDIGLYGELLYDITDATARSFFSLNHRTGVLTLAKTLDYEVPEQRQISIPIRAQDHGFPPHSVVININVSVVNVFDNVPTFMQPRYNTTLREDVEVGFSVEKVVATDYDGQKVLYSILSGNDQGHFLIDDTGALRVASLLDYDKPDGKVYHLVVRAADGTTFTDVPVIIRVLDANDQAPIFLPAFYELLVNEGERVGSDKLVVRATDGDSGSNAHLTYSISSRDPTLKVESVTGQVYIASTPDCDQGKGIYHEYTLWAMDGGSPPRNGTARLKLTIRDINDNAPVFDAGRLTGEVYENAARQTSVMTVTATDADYEPVNRRVRYQLAPESGKNFTIHPANGIIRTRSALDREVQGQYRLTVFAIDSGVPPLTSRTEVLINVLDKPDSPPVFAHTNRPADDPFLCYKSFIVENKPVGTSIITITATSPDSSVKQSSLRYSLQSGSDLFQINSTVGVISNKEVLDRDTGRHSYRFTVRATAFARFADCDVVVNVRDVNDNPPRVLNTDVFANLLQNSFRGGPVGRVHLIDPDTSIVVQRPLESPGFASGFFSLTPNGIIIASEDTLPGIYKLRSSANDSNANHSPAEGTTTVHIRWVTAASIQNIVTMIISNPTDKHNFIQQYYLRSTSAIGDILGVEQSKVEIFSVDAAHNERHHKNGYLDVIFAVRQADGQYMDRNIIIEDLDLQREVFSTKSGLRMVAINDGNCGREPCKHFQDCADHLRFLGRNDTIVRSNISFTSLHYHQSHTCTCPPGYLHDWHSESCQVEVDECASSPCMHGGTCIDRISGFSCLCLDGTTGDRCETFCPSAQCNFCNSSTCLHNGACATDSTGTVKCTCPSGYDGPRCEQTTASFTPGGFLAFPSISSRWELELSLTFATPRRNGLLLYNGRLGTEYDVLALEIVDGRVQCKVSLDGNPIQLTTRNTRVLSDAQWHTVTFQLQNQVSVLW